MCVGYVLVFEPIMLYKYRHSFCSPWRPSLEYILLDAALIVLWPVGAGGRSGFFRAMHLSAVLFAGLLIGCSFTRCVFFFL